MGDNTEVRWKQQFDKFEKALTLLRSAFEEREISSYSALEQEGIIQRFKYTYELGWKTIKAYLEYGGMVIKPATPRDVIKEAYKSEFIDDGQVWIEMIGHRNILSHDYDFDSFQEVLTAVEEFYLDAFISLYEKLLSEMK